MIERRMEVDGRTLDGATLETGICIAGAGPCGLVLAGALAERGVETVLLESGDATYDRRAQRLSRGRVDGDRYAGLRRTRRRQVGGTANTWNTGVEGELGAKYVPLDREDLDAWPLAWDELERWYREAQRVCGLGPFDYGADAHAVPDAAPPDLSGSRLENGVYQLGRRAIFTSELPEALRREPQVRLCRRSTLLDLHLAAGEQTVAEATAASRNVRFRVRARAFVLAAGAVENARLLLASAVPAPPATGRCFMEHPRDAGLVLVSPSLPPERLGFYAPHRGAAGVAVAGRLALGAELRSADDLPGASATILPSVRGRDVVRLEDGRTRQRLGRAAEGGAYGVLLNLEQAPHPENRVVLGRRLDGYGRALPELRWRWREEDQTRLVRLRETVAEELAGADLGRVVRTRLDRPDPNAHHHAGTTRMGADADEDGVVDADCRVRGIENLYASGASVFPTAGYANPTLTVVALALRLAGHLARDRRA